MRRFPLRIAATILSLPFLLSSPIAAETERPDLETVPSLGAQFLGQWTSADVPMRSESPESLRTSDATVDRLTLREAVVSALENNPGIAVERLGPRFARAGVAGAYGVFDPTFTAFGTLNRLIEPTGSVLAGAEVVRTRQIDFGARIEKLIRTGARLAVEYDSNELRQNSSFLGLRPQYRPELTFSVSQPLLRDFGLGLTVLLVRSAEAKSGAAFHEYRARVSSLILDVVRGYWEVVRTRELLAAEEEGLGLARTLERENEARVRAGVLPPIAVREAAADSASREERVILAKNALDVAGERLRLLVQRNPDRAFLPRRIEPVDSPDVREVEIDEAAILEAAVLARPELLRARYDVQNQEILVRARRNNLLPSLDLRGSYGLNGLSGREVPQVDFRTGETTTTRFGGNYAEALDRLFGTDYYSYSAGIELSVPIGNSAAESEYVQSQIDLRRSELSYHQLVSDVTLEVRSAITNVAANSKRITATRLARELAVENLEQQKKRYEVGLATTKDILDFQEDVTAARAAETGALIDYNLSLAALRRAEGSLLDRFDVVVDALPPPPAPLWSKF